MTLSLKLKRKIINKYLKPIQNLVSFNIFTPKIITFILTLIVAIYVTHQEMNPHPLLMTPSLTEKQQLVNDTVNTAIDKTLNTKIQTLHEKEITKQFNQNSNIFFDVATGIIDILPYIIPAYILKKMFEKFTSAKYNQLENINYTQTFRDSTNHSPVDSKLNSEKDTNHTGNSKTPNHSPQNVTDFKGNKLTWTKKPWGDKEAKTPHSMNNINRKYLFFQKANKCQILMIGQIPRDLLVENSNFINLIKTSEYDLIHKQFENNQLFFETISDDFIKIFDTKKFQIIFVSPDILDTTTTSDNVLNIVNILMDPNGICLFPLNLPDTSQLFIKYSFLNYKSIRLNGDQGHNFAILTKTPQINEVITKLLFQNFKINPNIFQN